MSKSILELTHQQPAKNSLKLFLSIAANEDFQLYSMNKTSAFLQGYPLDSEVYIKPLTEHVVHRKVRKLLKSFYGLNDASRKWFIAARDTLMNLGSPECTKIDDISYT